MNKKTVLIIVGVVASVAILAIAIFGIIGTSGSVKVFAEAINFEHKNIEEVDFAGGTRTFQLKWKIMPENATDKTVKFTSNNANVTVSESGLVTFNKNESAQITITTKDGSNLTDTVTFVAKVDKAVQVGYDFSQNKLVKKQDREGVFAYDGDTLNLYRGMDYYIDTPAIIAVKEADSNVIKQAGYTKVVGIGSATLTFTLGTETKEIVVATKEYLTAFGKGKNLSAWETNRDSKEGDSVYLDPNKTQTYEVGASDKYAPDLNVVNVLSESLHFGAYDVSLAISQKSGTTFTPITDNATVCIVDNAGIKFTQGAIGNTYKIIFSYANKLDIMGLAPVEMVYTVREGVNVNSDDEMKIKFGDLSVKDIYLHATLDIKLKDSQMLNGTPKNEGGHSGAVSDWNHGHAYYRYSANAVTDDLTVNGNYFSVSASSIPKTLNGGKVSEIMDVIAAQSSIMRIIYPEPATGTTAPNVIFNDINIIGNRTRNDKLPGDKETTPAGYIGIKNTGAKVIANNVILNKLQSAFVLEADGDANFVKSYETFDSTAFIATRKLTVTKSHFTQSGGPIFQLVDYNMTDLTANADPELVLDDATIVDNYVGGTEHWFVAYGVTAIIPTVKTSLQAGITQISGGTMKLFDSVESGKFNFVAMMGAANPMADSGYPNAKFTINGTTINRGSQYIADELANNTPTKDARVQSGSQGNPPSFIYPIGGLSDKMAFLTAVGGFMQGGDNQDAAVAKAFTQSFTENETGFVASPRTRNRYFEFRTMMGPTESTFVMGYTPVA